MNNINYTQTHNRKFVPSGIALKAGKLFHSGDITDQDYIESLILESGVVEEAPFLWIGFMYRYGFKTDLVPEYDKREIDPKDGEIAIAIELNMEILEWADKRNLKLFMEMMMIGALEALIHLGNKYKLKIDLIKQERLKFRDQIPVTIEECENLPKMQLKDYTSIRKYFRNDINVCSNCLSAKATEKARQCLVCGEFNDPILIKEKH